jgi:CBS domain-containing membrane protein
MSEGQSHMSRPDNGASEKPKRFKLFSPILAGASLNERLIACFGALIGIGVTGMLCGFLFGHGTQMPLIVAPLGASAVLLFAVPASPLAQPWPIIGGNTISALIGVTTVHFLPDPLYAIGIAVCLAILAMSFTRSLHPPGGAAALMAVIGGDAVKDAGFLFPFVPIAINSVALVALGILFHKLFRHNYPHKAVKPAATAHQTADKPPAVRVGFTADDIDGALSDLHESLDIDRNDIDELLRKVEQRALNRSHGEIKCKDIMSKDVVRVGLYTTPEKVRALLRQHDLRTLPVVSKAGKLAGIVGYAELEETSPDGRLPLSKSMTAHPEDAAISLLPELTSGKTHNIIIVDEQGDIAGVISQTDLLVALGKNLLWSVPT